MNKNDFVIKGSSTGSRISGREHQYLYRIYRSDDSCFFYPIDNYGFSSKQKANLWLSGYIKSNNNRG